MAKVKKTKSPAKKVNTSSKSGGAPRVDISNLESQVEGIFTKSLPSLPANAIETLVKIAPWLAIIGVVMGIPAIMTLLGVSRMAAYYRLAGMGLGWGYQLSNVLYIVQMVLTGLSIQGLFARKLSAWRLMYYATWISVVAGLLSGGIVNMLIVGLISFYLLFQVKKAYQ